MRKNLRDSEMVEYFVICSNSRPIEVESMAQVLREAGWNSATVKTFYDETLRYVDEEVLQAGNATIGWQANGTNSDFHAGVVRTGNKKTVESLCYQEKDIGHVSWEFQPSFDLVENLGIESEAQATELLEDWVIAKIRNANCMYSTSYMSNMPFVIAALAVVATLRSGVVFDPQCDLWFDAPSDPDDIHKLIQRWVELSDS
jgi:hypothetical protein